MLYGFTVGAILTTFVFWSAWLCALMNEKGAMHRIASTNKLAWACIGFTAFTLVLVAICVYFKNVGIAY